MTDMFDLAFGSAPPVLQSEPGEALLGGLSTVANLIQESFRQASRAYYTSDGVGPAYDAIDAIAKEQRQLSYPRESIADRIVRLSQAWVVADKIEENRIISELTAAGYPGASITYGVYRPGSGGPRGETGTWWSQYWITYTNPSFTFDLGAIIGDGLIVGSFTVSGSAAEDVSTIKDIIAAYSPAHWICRAVEFYVGQIIGDDLVIGSWNIGGTFSFFAIVG